MQYILLLIHRTLTGVTLDLVRLSLTGVTLDVALLPPSDLHQPNLKNIWHFPHVGVAGPQIPFLAKIYQVPKTKKMDLILCT